MSTKSKAAKKTTSTKATSRSKKAPSANGAKGDDGPMPGKKLLQSWVEDAYHTDFVTIAAGLKLRPATYLRQVICAHVDAKKAEMQEAKS
jgi:hypothetical protein